MIPFGGPLTSHMTSHILLMSAVAPLAVLASRAFVSKDRLAGIGGALAAATIAQLVLLWAWHAPPALELALRSPAADLTMKVSLLLAALWFWGAIFAAEGARRWRALVALLLTGKIFCLLGALLVFAPRALYSLPPLYVGHDHDMSDTLSDQQLAGLLMLTACPLTYVVAGVVIAAQWISGLLKENGAPSDLQPSVKSAAD